MSELSKYLNAIPNAFLGRGDLPMNDIRGERLQIMLSEEELRRIDDFRFKYRMPTRAAAVRELLKFGLATQGVTGDEGRKSSTYGVLGRSVGGRQADDGGSRG